MPAVAALPSATQDNDQLIFDYHSLLKLQKTMEGIISIIVPLFLNKNRWDEGGSSLAAQSSIKEKNRFSDFLFFINIVLTEQSNFDFKSINRPARIEIIRKTSGREVTITITRV